MLNRFPRALGTLASAAVLTAALGVLQAAPAGAVPTGQSVGKSVTRPVGQPGATPPCGASCASYFTREYGRRHVLNDFYARQAVGTPISLRRASNDYAKEDWTIWPAGTVAQLAALGLVSQKLGLNYGADQAFEIQFAPFGVGSGRCAGTAKAAVSGEIITLQWCGRGARTIWVADSAAASGSFTPLISGSDTNFSDPQVLTEPGSPNRWPRPWLTTDRLHTFAGGAVYDDQLWDDTLGVLP